MEVLQNILLIASLVLTLFNISVMLYGFRTFLRKPRTVLEDRVTILEAKVLKLEDSRDNGKEKFKMQERTNNVLIHSTLALIEFEMQYCLTEKKQMSDDLKRAKEDLHDFLAEK
ncbi:MAG: hypothetical protein II003_03285 [Methanobrevibacter sp.]|nr:hypothetical protein [Methanobrevibacter sp.]